MFSICVCVHSYKHQLPHTFTPSHSHSFTPSLPHTFTPLHSHSLTAPTLNVGEENVFTSTGQPTTLICEASGTPAPDVSWTHNEEPLDKERFIQLADASLFINDTDMQDEGSYLVKATNSAGTVEQLVRVTVIRPVPPEREITAIMIVAYLA